MHAIILAGGKGTRLRPFTVSLPKPLVPVGDYAIIEIVIRQLAQGGFDHITVSTGHLAELIEAYCGDGTRWGVRIDYVREHTPLSTAGALRLLDAWTEDALVMNGDILTTIDFCALVTEHVRRGVAATVATTMRTSRVDFGVMDIAEDGMLAGWTEKPSYELAVSMGVYVLAPRCRDFIGEGEALGMPDLLLRLKDAGERVYCHRTDAYWLDIGRVEDYETAQTEFESRRDVFLGEDG
jgi:NDP-sugar pyrophosphorylase family protein